LYTRIVLQQSSVFACNMERIELEDLILFSEGAR
jgi:hypothetical protein